MKRWSSYGILERYVTVEGQNDCRVIRGWGYGCVWKVDYLVVHVSVDYCFTWNVTFHVHVPHVTSNDVWEGWVDLRVDELVFVGECSVCSLQKEMKVVHDSDVHSE